jgi:heme exporter protein D
MAEFLHMGGYAFYVWWSYGVVGVVLAYHYFSPLVRRKKLIRELASSPLNRNAEQ